MRVALILARAGSKRIPNKNLVEICGKPMLHYPITAALEAEIFDKIVVSSDGASILEYAKSQGVDIHKRDRKLSDDNISAFEVIKKLLSDNILGVVDSAVITVMYGSSVFVTPTQIIEMLALLDTSDLVFAATEFSFPPLRGFKLVNNSLMPINEKAFLARSQDLEPWFHDVGQIYMATQKSWKNAISIYGEKSTFYNMNSSFVQDIDTYQDLELAELKLRKVYERTDTRV